MTEENSALVPCVNCSKLIAPDAAFCSFCGKEQNRQKKLPGQIRLFILNLLCPGAGDWALGAKLRGTIIFLVVIGSLVAYCLDIIPIVQKAVNQAILHNKIINIKKLEEEIGNNGWMFLCIISYVFAILDSFFLRINKQKLMEDNKNVSTD